MLFEIKVCPVVYSLYLSESSWIKVFYVCRSSCIMSEFFVVFESEMFRIDIDNLCPILHTIIFSLIIDFHSFFTIVFYKIFYFHLLKFPCSVEKLSWSDFISERF